MACCHSSPTRELLARAPTLSDYIDVPGVYPAGRLDMDSEGLMLLTDDGRLQARISDPKYKMAKTCSWVQVEGAVTDDALVALRKGVQLKDGMTLPAEAEAMAEPGAWLRDPPVRFARPCLIAGSNSRCTKAATGRCGG